MSENLPDQQLCERDWLNFEQLSVLTGWPRSALYKMKLRGKFAITQYAESVNGGGAGGQRTLIHITDPAIPPEARARYFQEIAREEATPAPAVEETHIIEAEMNLYASAPEWSRRKADKYIQILSASAGLKGAELKSFVAEWNAGHPGDRTSYQRVVAARSIYRDKGVSGLLAKYGRLANRSDQPSYIEESWFGYFKSAYLVEGGPSPKVCWMKTMGFARRQEQAIRQESFPSVVTFLRRMAREIPQETIYLARHGRSAWNRKYAPYVDRSLEGLRANECWVGDHHQVDIAVRFPDGKVGFPWASGWVDFKSTTILSLYLHPEAPNSDHVFFSFQRAARKYGVPGHIYIDNGKDYRCRDFAGGRTHFHRISVKEGKAASMVAHLGITPHFSLPYNAQAKVIERVFLKVKDWISRGMPGFRGGNTVEKPEKLKEEIKRGKILEWTEFVSLVEFAVSEIINKMPSEGKLAGACPLEVFEKDAPVFRMVGVEALKLFCMRTSRPLTIGRNGVRDGEVGRTYWGEWMAPLKGAKVYLRRDSEFYQDAWAFRADNDEYLGQAGIAEQVDGLARTPESKAVLKATMSRNRAHEKLVRSYLPDPSAAPAPRTALEDFASGIAAVNEARGYVPQEKPGTVIAPARTVMDDVVAQRREAERTGTMDISAIVPMPSSRKKLYMYESDKLAAEGKAQ